MHSGTGALPLTVALLLVASQVHVFDIPLGALLKHMTLWHHRGSTPRVDASSIAPTRVLLHDYLLEVISDITQKIMRDS